MWNLISVRLKMVLVLVQGRCTLYTKCMIGSENVLDAPNGTPGDVAQLEARFDPFIGSANLDAKSFHGLRRTYYRVRKLF
jgi:hypothetical protein